MTGTELRALWDERDSRYSLSRRGYLDADMLAALLAYRQGEIGLLPGPDRVAMWNELRGRHERLAGSVVHDGGRASGLVGLARTSVYVRR